MKNHLWENGSFNSCMTALNHLLCLLKVDEIDHGAFFCMQVNWWKGPQCAEVKDLRENRTWTCS